MHFSRDKGESTPLSHAASLALITILSFTTLLPSEFVGASTAQSSGRGTSGTQDEGQVLAVARIGNDVITARQLRKLVERVQPGGYELVAGGPLEREILDHLINLEVLALEAGSLGIANREEILEKLADVSRVILAKAYLEQFLASEVDVTDTEVRAYFDTHLDDYWVPERILAPFILLKIPAGSSTDKVAAKRGRLDQIRALALQGASMQDLIKRYSESIFDSRTSDSDYFSRGRLVPEIEEQVFSLAVDEISPLFELPDSLLFFKLEDRKPGYQKTFEEVREEIRSHLREDKRQLALSNETERLRKKYHVWINEALEPVD